MPKHKPIKFETTLEPTLKKELERIIKENPRAKSVINATLALVAVGGVLTFGPAALGLIREIGRIRQNRKKENYEEYQQIWRNFQKMRKRKELEFVKEKDGYLVYRTTEKGKEKIKNLIFDEMKLKKPKKWDSKWRLVIFDIPESYKKAREALRRKLKEMDFYQCQKSAWIHPFPCLEEIEFLKNTFNIKPFVKLFLVDEMTDGKALYNFRDLIKSAMIK